MSIASWLDQPAVQPGGALAVEKKGTLDAFDVVPGILVPVASGVHRYAVSAPRGYVLQARVATDAFDPLVVVIAPSGRRWDLSSGVKGPDSRAAGAPNADLTLPEDGEYMVVVTSRANIDAGVAVTSGEYRLTLLCDAPPTPMPSLPLAAPSSRSGRFGAWESEPR